jgi:oxygen-independent coproporphyrinogen-3 oxidase
METGEFTIEANPESLDRNKLENLRQMGFNRLSLGIQSFHEDDLRFLGRIHNVQQAVDAFEMARQSGFHNINLDLMTAFPGLTPTKFSISLGRAVSLQPEHISCYSLIFEKGTPFYHQMKSGKFSPLSDEEEKEYYEMVQDVLSRHGYTAYEISNFARSADNYCKHNLKYWNHHSYLGFGPSAHTFVKPKRWSNIRALPAYMEKLAEDILPISYSETLNESQLELEYIFLHLRLKDGIDMHEYQRRFGKDFTSSYSETIKQFAACGMIGILDDRLFLTSKGWLLADEIAVAF